MERIRKKKKLKRDKLIVEASKYIPRGGDDVKRILLKIKHPGTTIWDSMIFKKEEVDVVIEKLVEARSRIFQAKTPKKKKGK